MNSISVKSESHKEKVIVITTINDITKAVQKFREVLPDWKILLVGDKKSVNIETDDVGIEFLSVDNQVNQPFSILEHLPYNHYVRKNVGYLYALMNGAKSVYDTDDDNIPYADWDFPSFSIEEELVSGNKFFNAYKPFTNSFIWPRGYPLDEIQTDSTCSIEKVSSKVGVWQGLADLDPDVDAIFRLLFSGDITFEKRSPLVLDQGVYCPFNSQNTLWHRDMLPYAYLPSTVTFRFTDILRGYIAQRGLWAHGMKLGFTQASVYQERNAHDLMKDFSSEIPCYTQIKELVDILDSLVLSDDWRNNLLVIYQSLSEAGIVEKEELPIVEAWVNDINKWL